MEEPWEERDGLWRGVRWGRRNKGVGTGRKGVGPGKERGGAENCKDDYR